MVLTQTFKKTFHSCLKEEKTTESHNYTWHVVIHDVADLISVVENWSYERNKRWAYMKHTLISGEQKFKQPLLTVLKIK